MRRILLALVAMGSILSATANGANSASLTLQGTVMVNAGLLITLQSGYNSLNILGGENNKLVATVTEHSNGNNGYRVILQSANASAGASDQSTSTQPTLNGTGASPDRVAYSITYNGQPVMLDGKGTATVTSTTTRSSRYGDTKPLQVTINPTWVSADTYSDTLILTLRNNN